VRTTIACRALGGRVFEITLNRDKNSWKDKDEN